MKRFLAVMLVLAAVLGMCACSGPITPSDPTSGESIPTTPEVPTAAPTEPWPTEAQKSEAVTNVELLIAGLSEISMEDEMALITLNHIQELYNALSPAEKAQVENYAAYEAAWDNYNALANKAAAEEIINAIANMGDATYKNRQAVIDAMKLYNSADQSIQAHVTNADDLKAAAATVAEAMMDKMAKEEDWVRGLAFYYHSQWPRGKEYWYADQRCFALPYLGTEGNSIWLRFVCNYTNDNWVFFERITFACDDERYYKTFSYYDVVRDNDGGEVWEYMDMDVNAYEIEILEAIASSSKTVIRFEGDEYVYDFTVSKKDKEAIRFTLDLYYLLGGK